MAGEKNNNRRFLEKILFSLQELIKHQEWLKNYYQQGANVSKKDEVEAKMEVAQIEAAPVVKPELIDFPFMDQVRSFVNNLNNIVTKQSQKVQTLVNNQGNQLSQNTQNNIIQNFNNTYTPSSFVPKVVEKVKENMNDPKNNINLWNVFSDAFSMILVPRQKRELDHVEYLVSNSNMPKQMKSEVVEAYKQIQSETRDQFINEATNFISQCNKRGYQFSDNNSYASLLEAVGMFAEQYSNRQPGQIIVQNPSSGFNHN